MKQFKYFLTLGLAIWTMLLPAPAMAYIGPGTGLGAIAVMIALFLGFALLIIGLVWFPLKRRLKNSNKTAANGDKDHSL